MIPAGQYEGEPIKGKFQLGETNTGTLQMAVDLELFDSNNKSVGAMTTFLYFSESAAVHSYARLRALGWKGSGADDIDKTDDCVNRVPCRVTAPEMYEDPKTKEKKLGSSKLEIMAGAGQVELQKPLTADAFKARLKALSPGGGGSSSAGGTPPPF